MLQSLHLCPLYNYLKLVSNFLFSKLWISLTVAPILLYSIIILFLILFSSIVYVGARRRLGCDAHCTVLYIDYDRAARSVRACSIVYIGARQGQWTWAVSNSNVNMNEIENEDVVLGHRIADCGVIISSLEIFC